MIHREEKVCVAMEAETEVIQPQAKVCLEPPEAWRGEEGFSLRAFEGSGADSLSVGFQPPKWWKDKFLLFYHTQPMVICYNN